MATLFAPDIVPNKLYMREKFPKLFEILPLNVEYVIIGTECFRSFKIYCWNHNLIMHSHRVDIDEDVVLTVEVIFQTLSDYLKSYACKRCRYFNECFS